MTTSIGELSRDVMPSISLDDHKSRNNDSMKVGEANPTPRQVKKLSSIKTSKKRFHLWQICINMY